MLVALLFGLTFFAFFYMSDLLKLFSNALGKISQRMGGKKSKPFQWTQRKIHEMAEDFHAIKARRTYLPVTVTSLVAWTMAFWMFYALMKGFGVSVTFSKVIFGSTIAIVANTLPISGLGNWGILEAGWTAGFLLVGLSKVEAITTGFGVHIIIFITGVVTSLVCWVTLNLPQQAERTKPFPQLAKWQKPVERRAFLRPKGLNQTLWLTFRFEAFRGFNLKLSSLTSFLMCVAKLQDPFAHFRAGSE